MKSALRLTVALCVLSFGLTATAYNPPVDRAGPLSVRIEGPGEVTRVETPVPVRVVLENHGGEALEGTVHIGLIDRWRCDPAGPVKFKLGPRSKAALEFKVIAGEGTYSAHYPIHAYARFATGGKELSAHPILILQTKLRRRPRAAAPVAWKPLAVPRVGEVALWRVPVLRAVVLVFGEKPLTMPVGWQGSEERSFGSLFINRQTLGDVAREVVGIHPPWRDGHMGTLAVELPLQLPKTTPLRLKFAQGMTPTGHSDGVTFRVRVVPLDAPEGTLGQVVFERHSAAKTWTDGEADLGAFAGQAVRLQLESHPGPKNDTGWDQSYWAEPTLVAGTPPGPPPFPPTSDEGSRVIGTAKCGGAEYAVRVWPGRRGLLDAAVGFCNGKQRVAFRGFHVRVLGGRIDDARSPVMLEETKEEKCDGGYQVRHRFRSQRGPFDLVGRLWIDRGVLRAKFHLEDAPKPQPWLVVRLEDTAAGPWNQPARAVYAGHGNVLRDPGPYRLGFDGHRLATSFVGMEFGDGLAMVQAVDLPPDCFLVEPAERHYSLHAPDALTLTFIPAPNVWEGVKTYRDTNGLVAAGGVKKAAGRFVFDLWGGHYAPSAEALRRSFRYGLTDAMVVWHNWQRWGYDYRLPEIYPPNPKLGTLHQMQDLARACREAGVVFAPHDNYIDFYPDAEGFSYEKNIAFHAGGTPVRAWLNKGRDAQSYRYRSDRIEPYLRANVELVKKNLGATGYFIDVWSSIGPYSYWTADGRFYTKKYSRDTWGRHFAWIRDTLGGDAPQISESGHDQLVGWLDGAQTNHLRVGPPVEGSYYGWCVWDWKCSDAERVPWLDAAHHDRFVLHGAGYSGRYQGGLDGRLHGIYSDDYLATEVLDGHPTMVSEPFGRDVVRKYWLTSRLMRALALRRIESVEFAGGDLHRQHVSWSGGAHVWVNRGPSDWTVEGTVLPEYGFLARVPVGKDKEAGLVEASVSRRGGVIVETARSPEWLYVNGRQVVHGPLPIRPLVQGFKDIGGGKFEIALKWQADAPIPAGWYPFVHFCDTQEEIVFQAGHSPGVFGTERQGTIAASISGHVPGGAAPGTQYELRIGIYNRETGERLRLSGTDDGTRRIRLGSLGVTGQGQKVTGMSWTTLAPQPDLVLARQNPEGKPIDFGPVTTCGGCRLVRQGETLVLTPLPDGDKRFSVAIRWDKLPWKLPEPAAVEAMDESGKVTAHSPVRREGDRVLVDCDPGVFCYRVTGK